ncbi:hypothetical protein HER32_01630 [Hymenobacter sp. BT18]|uniref:hypothetical protein n=1 Tax=Hymenobacter sp. BT18 TaxID=2835648 RepID=UPI00143EAA07|nr:hypothetical protein [Hymenobacter sp. BT18]QIX59959.1 hypothetical protein HER32_01630 [Hymenobacter sp. BT18]
MPRFLPLAPRLAAYLFALAVAAFFFLNPAAFQKLAAVNLLQFNLQGVKYAFIMSLFAYALPGVVLTGYFGWLLLRSPTRFRAPAALLALAGIILLQLGTISTAPEFPGRTLYVMLLTWTFPTLHGVAWLWLAFTDHLGIRRFANAALGLYLLYQVPGSFLFGADEVQANIPIALCFGWYFSCHVLFQSASPNAA